MKQDRSGKSNTRTGILILSVLLIVGALAALFAAVANYTREDGYEYLIGLSQPDLTENAQLALYNDVASSCAAEGSAKLTISRIDPLSSWCPCGT